jgi:DNA-binding response OmpR family regulator
MYEDFNRRLSDPILVLEDRLENQLLLEKLITKFGLSVVVVSNGEEGLKLLDQGDRFSLFIVDLVMPVMDGKTFISQLKRRQADAVIIVQSAVDTTDEVIEIMRMGVFDYLIKPVEPEQLHRVLKKSVDYYDLRQTEKQLQVNSGLLLRKQLEWLNYKESRRKTDATSSEMLSIQNLRTSLSQGAGVGAMVTIIELIKGTAKPEGEGFYVDGKLLGMLFENTEIVQAILSGLESISEIMEKECELQHVSSSDLISVIPAWMKRIEEILPKKNLKITYPVLNHNCDLAVNLPILADAMEELVVNAYKYTVQGTSLDIFAYISGSYLCIAVKNDVPEKPYGGIPPEYEKLVTEPFFRILPPEESAAKVEKYGLGLGLTVVEHVARKHNGLFSIHDVKDHTGDKVKSSVVAEIYLPVLS